jgi:flavoprotein
MYSATNTLAEWVADRQEYGDDGTGHCDYSPTDCAACLPNCDTCGADSEAVEWCGECGNCREHCDTDQIHDEGGE